MWVRISSLTATAPKKSFSGEESRLISFDDVMRILDAGGIEIEKGDIVCCYTGYADKLIELGADVPPDLPRTQCPAFEGFDQKLLQCIDDSGMAVLVSDNRALEYEHGTRSAGTGNGSVLPIHEHCLFTLGIHFWGRCGNSPRSPNGWRRSIVIAYSSQYRRFSCRVRAGLRPIPYALHNGHDHVSSLRLTIGIAEPPS